MKDDSRIVESRMHKKKSASYSLQLCSYRTKVHQIFIRCSHIIATSINARICIAILQLIHFGMPKQPMKMVNFDVYKTYSPFLEACQAV